MSQENTAAVIDAYYATWKTGTFDEARARELLASDLDFEGPISGKRKGREPFIAGLAQVSRSVLAFRPRQIIVNGDEAAALYECDLSAPKATVRFVEVFRVVGGKIQSLQLVYDPTEFRKSS
jgi:hypothetical protein